MKKEDIQHLATLSRIRLTDEEMSQLETDLSSIMSYVSAVTDIAGSDAATEPNVGAVYNVLRKDEITNQPNEFSEDIIKEMPHTEGRLLAVKKILNTDT